MDKVLKLQELIDKSKKIVFFSGAGVSTESGIKDFRSVDGIYNEKYDYPPEEILSHRFFLEHTDYFFKFYRDKLDSRNVGPNITHNYLKKLEDTGKDVTIVTQNIDGLHEKAMSSKVLLLHGTIFKNYCMICHKEYDVNDVFDGTDVLFCNCGGLVKPDVVLYGEALNDTVIDKAIKAITECDLLIVAGTSLNVYPAASFINFYQGDNLVIINKEATSYDSRASLVINDKLGNIISKLK